MYSECGLGVNDVERLNSLVGDGREEADGVEKVTDYVFLCKPAVFTVAVVEGRAGGGFVYRLFSPLNWYHKIMRTLKYQIYSLQ